MRFFIGITPDAYALLPVPVISLGRNEDTGKVEGVAFLISWLGTEVGCEIPLPL